MNPFELIENKFEDVKDNLSHTGISGVFDDLEDGEEQQFSVKAKDGSWEISLGNDQTIEAIFLHCPDSFENILGFGSWSSLEVIENIYGNCTSFGEPS